MMKVTILGARGSVPTDGSNMRVFGGATSSIMAEVDGSVIFLDAGTGIISAPDIRPSHVTILLTHPHIDHLLGLPFFPYLNRSGTAIDIYAGTKEELDAKAQIDSFMSPPRWPCTIDELPKETRLLTILDIYDALTAEDRPYKPPMPPEKAFGILTGMAKEGKLDRGILELFIKSEVWKKDE